MKNLRVSLAIFSLIALMSVSVKAQSVSKVQKVESIDKNSDYMSVEMENKIKSFLVSGVIPASLPKYVSGTKQDYSKIVKGWAKENLNLIKPEFHDKVLGKKKSKKPASRKE